MILYILYINWFALTTCSPSKWTLSLLSIISSANLAIFFACVAQGSGIPLTAMYLSPTVSTWNIIREITIFTKVLGLIWTLSKGTQMWLTGSVLANKEISFTLSSCGPLKIVSIFLPPEASRREGNYHLVITEEVLRRQKTKRLEKYKDWIHHVPTDRKIFFQ